MNGHSVDRFGFAPFACNALRDVAGAKAAAGELACEEPSLHFGSTTAILGYVIGHDEAERRSVRPSAIFDQ
jgi:hypothetical protein